MLFSIPGDNMKKIVVCVALWPLLFLTTMSYLYKPSVYSRWDSSYFYILFHFVRPMLTISIVMLILYCYKRILLSDKPPIATKLKWIRPICILWLIIALLLYLQKYTPLPILLPIMLYVDKESFLIIGIYIHLFFAGKA